MYSSLILRLTFLGEQPNFSTLKKNIALVKRENSKIKAKCRLRRSKFKTGSRDSLVNSQRRGGEIYCSTLVIPDKKFLTHDDSVLALPSHRWVNTLLARARFSLAHSPNLQNGTWRICWVCETKRWVFFAEYAKIGNSYKRFILCLLVACARWAIACSPNKPNVL
jgi:hypothetical protein